MPLFDSFMEASIRARILNITCLLFTFLACVGCCVGFAGDLFAVSFPAGDGVAHWSFYQSFIQTDANRIEFSGPNCVWSFCDTCLSGGKGFLAMQARAHNQTQTGAPGAVLHALTTGRPQPMAG